MSDRIVERIDELPSPSMRGTQKLWTFGLQVSVDDSSFLHIGGAPTPLSDIKMQVFKVDRVPVIPATTFKGALRHQMDAVFLSRQDEIAKNLDVAAEMLKPCIPTASPSKAEKEILKGQYRVTVNRNNAQHCALANEEDRVSANAGGICPVCYFLGAAGLPGFLRFTNFLPVVGSSTTVIQQARLRTDRRTEAAAPGALVTAEQVRPSVQFSGGLEVLEQVSGFYFGECRHVGKVPLDPWLSGDRLSLSERRLFLLNEILFVALRNITQLGGMRSAGAGRVKVEVLM